MSFQSHFSNLPLTKTYGRLFWRFLTAFFCFYFQIANVSSQMNLPPKMETQDSQAPVWVWYLPLVGTWNWPLVGANLDSGGSRTNRWPSDRDPSAIFWNISRNTNNSSPLTQALHKKSQTPSWMWWWAQRGSQGMEKDDGKEGHTGSTWPEHLTSENKLRIPKAWVKVMNSNIKNGKISKTKYRLSKRGIFRPSSSPKISIAKWPKMEHIPTWLRLSHRPRLLHRRLGWHFDFLARHPYLNHVVEKRYSLTTVSVLSTSHRLMGPPKERLEPPNISRNSVLNITSDISTN